MSKKWKPKKGETYWSFDFYGNVHQRTYDGDSFDSQLMALGNMFERKKEAESAFEKTKAFLLSLQEPVTDCNQLLKLTAEVFDRPDCPEWAKFAVVDVQGLAYWYQYPPLADERIGVWKAWGNKRQLIDGFFDRSDWQNSLIERPEKKQASSDENLRNVKYRVFDEDYQREQYIDFLKNKKSELAVFPEWCKVGEWVYSPCCCDPNKGTYFKVTQINGVCIIGEENVCHVDNAVRARLRPYNTEEMQALVGKIICWDRREKIYIVECCADFYGEISVYFGGNEHSAKDLIVGKYILSDGKPCGVLEHLNENGEWVE